MITAKRVREVLDYDQQTGVFRWRVTHHRIVSGKVAGRDNLNGYRRICIDRKNYYAHRLAWLYVHGEWPDEIDHINMVRDDNRLANLRSATRAQNSANRTKQSNNKIGFKGVVLFRPTGRYMARVNHEYLGYFDTPEQAHAAYAEAAGKYFGKFARA